MFFFVFFSLVSHLSGISMTTNETIRHEVLTLYKLNLPGSKRNPSSYNEMIQFCKEEWDNITDTFKQW